jgi:hypothetical protein
MAQAQRVLLMDAFISQRSISLLQDLAIPFTFYHYTHPQTARTSKRISSEDGFLKSLIDDLQSEKKIFLFCSSFKQLTTKILHHIRLQIPGIKVLEYHRHSPQSLADGDINMIWSNAQLVAVTSTITVGCNFDLPGVFHKLYVYASASCKNLVRDMFQSTYRVRHLVDNEMVYFVDPKHYGTNVSLDPQQIRATVNLKELYSGSSLPTPAWLTNLYTINTLEYNLSIMQLESLFHYYLQLCNYSQLSSEEEIMLDLEFTKQQPISYSYDEIPEILSDAVHGLIQKRNNKTITLLETAQLEKY